MMETAVRWRPRLAVLPEAQRLSAVAEVWLSLLLLPAAVGAVIWLLLATEPEGLLRAWWVLLLLFVLRFLLGQLDFGSVWGVSALPGWGAYGRFLTWTAALYYGPIALWLDGLQALSCLYEAWRYDSTGRRPDGWRLLFLGSVLVVRDILPSLLGLWLYETWGGTYPVVALSGAVVGATAVRVLGTVAVVTLVTAVTNSDRPVSRFSRLQWRLQIVLAVVMAFVFPEPFALFAVVIWRQMGLVGLALFVVGLLLVGVVVQRLGRTAVSREDQVHRYAQLEALSRDLLARAVDQPALPEMLAMHVPAIFANAWVEIRQLPDTILFVQAADWEPLAEEFWQNLVVSGQSYQMVPAVAAAAGYSEEGLLVPITAVADRHPIGGVYLLTRPGDDVLTWLPVVQALAGQIAAMVHKQATFEQALAEQAEAFEQEVYVQAYQAEVFAQALAYEKVSRELVAAGQIQASFLPQSLPEIPGWQLAVTLEPARETSGDFYDVIELGNGRVGLLVADVADKGIGPALFMALSRTMIRIYASDNYLSPAAVLAEANHRILTDTSSELFVTVFYAIIDTHSGQLTYCNAGHNPAYLWQNGRANNPLALTRTALPLGILPDVDWQQGEVMMAAGDVLVIYSDGITEAQDDVARFFGEERLQQVITKYIDRPADVIESRVVDAVYDFTGDTPQSDDITLMVLVRES